MLTTRSYRTLLSFCLARKTRGPVPTILQHCEDTLGNAEARNKMRDELRKGKKSTGRLRRDAGCGVEQHEWRTCLQKLLKRGWITKPEMERYRRILE